MVMQLLSSTNILTVSDAPTWTTASGTLGTFAGDFSGTLATLSATSDSAITFQKVHQLTTAGVTLNTSTGALEYYRFRWSINNSNNIQLYYKSNRCRKPNSR
jgi:hypothetical protein